MLAVGYVDDNTGDVPGNGYLLVKNSWSNKWAYDNKDHQGYAKIPYSYIEKYGSDIAFTIEVCAGGNDLEDDGWPPKKDPMEKYIKIASKMMKNRKGLFNIGKGESIIEDPETGKVDKDTPANRQIFIENGYSWEKKDL